MVTDFPKKGDNKKVSLRNSNYKQFDYAFALDLRTNHPDIWRKGGNIRGNSAFTNWGKVRLGKSSASLDKWIREREAWAARHHNNYLLAGVVAQLKWGVIGSRGMSYMKNLINEQKNKPTKKRKSEKIFSVGDYCRWKQSGNIVRGRILKLVYDGKIKIPNTNMHIMGTQHNPAALLEVYHEKQDQYVPSGKFAGHKVFSLVKIPKLKTSDTVLTEKNAATMFSTQSKVVNISKINEEEQIVFGVVYSPYEVDTHGDMMLPDDIKLMAQRYMQLKDLKHSIDTNHDNVSNGSYPVESFIARENDEDYPEGSWVLGVKITDDKVWSMVKNGELNGYSFEALVKKVPAAVRIETLPQQIGVTEVSNDHSHFFFVELNKDGCIVRGRTSTDNGHAHEIIAGTATSEENGHSHRIFVT